MDGILSRKFGRVLGIDGFIFTSTPVLPVGTRYSALTVSGGARGSSCGPLLEMCPRQCRYSMCQALTFPWTSERNALLTMLSSMMGRLALSLARCITIISTASVGRSFQGVLLFKLLWRFLTTMSSDPPGTYPSPALFLPDKEDALLDFKIFAAVLIGFPQEHAPGQLQGRDTC